MRWGDVRPYLPPAPAWSAFCAATEGHRAVGAVLRDAFYSPRPASRGLPSSPETAAPTAQHGPPGTVAVINIGMWLGMRTAQGQVLLLQMSSVTVKKSRAAYMPSCPLPACFFFCVCVFFLAQNPPEVPRSSFSEAQEAGFS